MAFTWNFGDAFNDFTRGIKNVGNWIGDTFFGGSSATNETNQHIAQENIEYQKWANEQNIAFQKQENDITRQREDNAVTRAAQDMANAGLSKTLAAGNPASAQHLTAPQTQALNNSFKMEKNLAGLNMIKEAQNIIDMKKDNKRADELNDAQVDLIKSQTEGNNIANANMQKEYDAKIGLAFAQTETEKTKQRLNNAQAFVEETVGKYKTKEIETDIDYKISQIFKNKSEVLVNKAQYDKIIEEITSEVLKQNGIKLDNYQKFNQLKIQVKEMAKMHYEIEGLKHNLIYAQKNDLPVGAVPGNILGINIGAGKSIWHSIMNNPSYTSGVRVPVKEPDGNFYEYTLPMFEYSLGDYPMFLPYN